jgi:hypothetical protein
MKYPVTGGDPIESTADMKVEYYNSNADYSGTPYLTLDINNGDIAEVNLSDAAGANKYSGTLTLCWQNPEAAIYYSLNTYYASCSCNRGALKSDAGFTEASNTSTDGFDVVSVSDKGFTRCHTFSPAPSGNYDSLRIRALYARTLVGIFTSGTLNNQGYRLTSIGKITGGSSEVVKKVVVYRSYPFMPAIFDAAILSVEGQIN